MKFNHEFQSRLVKDGFPAHWVESAISYGRLKKCIKRIERELTALGLDLHTLNQLLKSVEEIHEPQDGRPEPDDRPFEYRFEKDENGAPSSPNSPTIGARKRFIPKLLFAVDEVTGEPVDATLSIETRNYLHQLAVAEGLSDVRIIDEETLSNPSRRASDASSTLSSECGASRRHSKTAVRLVEVPLTSDGEFFSVLQKEVFGLSQLQKDEQSQLTTKIVDLGHLIAKLTDPSDSKSKHDIEHWRRIFDQYLASRIFFAATERDHGAHSYAAAQPNLAAFLAQTKGTKFKKRASAAAFQAFVDINLQLLQSLHFQELNRTALAKIVKKFDKRTGLRVTSALPPAFAPAAVLSPDFAKSLAAAVAAQIVNVVPRLDDYLCPICFSIAYRPVRLRCQHIFCIRCLITLQREGKGKCALCREESVMEADSENLDPALAQFLKKYFPAEVKAKQRENELAIAREQFGDLYDARCAIM